MVQIASSLIKSKTLLQVLIVLNIFRLYLFAHVDLFTKCSVMDEHLDVFKTLTCVSSFFSENQKFSTLFGHALLSFSLDVFLSIRYRLLYNSMVVYQFSFYCKASYIELSTRHLRKRIKEHVPKSVENFWFSEKKDDTQVKVVNTSKRSFIREHLVNNSTCANSYNLNRIKNIKTCSNVFDLIKLEAISILLRKPVWCKQKYFVYTVFIFS